MSFSIDDFLDHIARSISTQSQPANMDPETDYIDNGSPGSTSRVRSANWSNNETLALIDCWKTYAAEMEKVKNKQELGIEIFL